MELLQPRHLLSADLGMGPDQYLDTSLDPGVGEDLGTGVGDENNAALVSGWICPVPLPRVPMGPFPPPSVPPLPDSPWFEGKGDDPPPDDPSQLAPDPPDEPPVEDEGGKYDLVDWEPDDDELAAGEWAPSELAEGEEYVSELAEGELADTIAEPAPAEAIAEPAMAELPEVIVESAIAALSGGTPPEETFVAATAEQVGPEPAEPEVEAPEVEAPPPLELSQLADPFVLFFVLAAPDEAELAPQFAEEGWTLVNALTPAAEGTPGAPQSPNCDPPLDLLLDPLTLTGLPSALLQSFCEGDEPVQRLFTAEQIEDAIEDMDYNVMYPEREPIYRALVSSSLLTDLQRTRASNYLGSLELRRGLAARREYEARIAAELEGNFGRQVLHHVGVFGATFDLGVRAMGVVPVAVVDQTMRTGVEAAASESLDLQIAGNLIIWMGIGTRAALEATGELANATSRPVIGTGTLVVAGSVGAVQMVQGEYDAANVSLGIAEAGICHANPFSHEPHIENAIAAIQHPDVRNTILGFYRLNELLVPGVEAIVLPTMIRSMHGNCFVAGTQVIVVQPVDCPQPSNSLLVQAAIHADCRQPSDASDSHGQAAEVLAMNRWVAGGLLGASGTTLLLVQANHLLARRKQSSRWEQEVDALMLLCGQN